MRRDNCYVYIENEFSIGHKYKYGNRRLNIVSISKAFWRKEKWGNTEYIKVSIMGF